jgi:uncharacterized protein (TIGR03086 family)
MSENSRRYLSALYALDAVAKRVPAQAWDNQSCCEAWTARQVAGHAAWVIHSTAAATGNLERPEPTPEADFAGADPAATIRAAVDAAAEALDQQGALAHVAATPFGEMPVDDFLGVIWVDPLTHAWDIADATGVAHGIAPETAVAAKATLEPVADALRGPGRFDAAVNQAGDDPLAEFVAFTGRTPVGN